MRTRRWPWLGAGNSAGQAVVYLAPRVPRLHLIVRGRGLDASMSRYLIERIAALPNVVLHCRCQVTALAGDAASGRPEFQLYDQEVGTTTTMAIQHLFLFIGADPNTAWLSNCPVGLDASGFVRTGDAAVGRRVPRQAERDRRWKPVSEASSRSATSVRLDERVAAAVGEGAQVVAALHGILAAP